MAFMSCRLTTTCRVRLLLDFRRRVCSFNTCSDRSVHHHCLLWLSLQSSPRPSAASSSPSCSRSTTARAACSRPRPSHPEAPRAPRTSGLFCRSVGTPRSPLPDTRHVLRPPVAGSTSTAARSAWRTTSRRRRTRSSSTPSCPASSSASSTAIATPRGVGGLANFKPCGLRRVVRSLVVLQARL